MKFLKYNASKKGSIVNQFFGLKFGFIIVCIGIFSCESFVEVELPNDQINSETVFENAGTARAAMAYIYNGLRNNVLLQGNQQSITYFLGLYTDELDQYSNTDPSFYNNVINPSTGAVLNIWRGSYELIYAANRVIEGVNNSTAISQADKDQLMGEALFTRALLHFYLVNLYGDIPYIDTTNYRENNQASKTPAAEVYQQIIIDLLTAKSVLPDAYLFEERTLPNKGVASALLSRVYLYTQDWENAGLESTALINNTGIYAWETDLERVFFKESPSTIWQFKPLVEGGNTQEGATFIFFTPGPPPSVALTSTLLDAFETGSFTTPGDQRRSNWVETVTGSSTWYHAYKYKESGNTENEGASMEYSKQFRLAEQYLIRAETRAQLGDISGAQQDINTIRSRAGLTSTTAATTDDLLDAILQERRVEFFAEKGHRFFDLKRMGKLDAVLSLVKSGWNTTDALFPIPEDEILNNSNLLPQNDGYN